MLMPHVGLAPLGSAMEKGGKIDFDALFTESRSRGEPLWYNGNTLVRLDRWKANPGDVFEVTIESTSSGHPQGVGASEDVEVFGQRVKRAVIWEYFSLPSSERGKSEAKLPFVFQVIYRGRPGLLNFYNMTEYKGRQEWWTRGHAMIVERLPGLVRYRCNDFDPDDDFDDLVFTVHKVTATGATDD
jgi:hypothetical protein